MSKKYQICEEPGPCWRDYIYIGPEPKTKGSCIKKSKLCNMTKGKGIQCKKKINCHNSESENESENEELTINKKSKENYQQCLKDAKIRFNKKKLKLCPEGYCSAKYGFQVYPSAYANAYASSVCQGKKKNLLGIISENSIYMNRLEKRKEKPNSLQRWFREKWVNVCEKGDGPGGYQDCGTGKGVHNIRDYPYCRPYYKLKGTTVITAPELSKSQLEKMCRRKRSLPQGVDGKPTRIFIKKINKETDIDHIEIPDKVVKNAKLGLKLRRLGYSGGTNTGINRGYQLSRDKTIDLLSLANMRTWFSRHGPDAKNKGTSYRGYCIWLKDGRPLDSGKDKYRGAVAWLLWGGNEAYLWLKNKKIRKLLKKYYPKRKESIEKNNLFC